MPDAVMPSVQELEEIKALLERIADLESQKRLLLQENKRLADLESQKRLLGEAGKRLLLQKSERIVELESQKRLLEEDGERLLQEEKRLRDVRRVSPDSMEVDSARASGSYEETMALVGDRLAAMKYDEKMTNAAKSGPIDTTDTTAEK